MQVKHFLPAAFAGVDLCFEAVRQAVCRGDLRHFQHHFRHQSRITALKVTPVEALRQFTPPGRP